MSNFQLSELNKDGGAGRGIKLFNFIRKKKKIQTKLKLIGLRWF